jgi:hypothetical protein
MFVAWLAVFWDFFDIFDEALGATNASTKIPVSQVIEDRYLVIKIIGINTDI